MMGKVTEVRDERGELPAERDEVFDERQVLGRAEQEGEGRAAASEDHVVARTPRAQEGPLSNLRTESSGFPAGEALNDRRA